MNPNRWPLLLALATLLLSGCGRDEGALAPILPADPPRNVLIISFDALRADALGLYGYDRPTSPNLDRFAEGAVVFERAHSAAQSTPTSFAALFTGRYPFRVFRGWKLVDDRTLAAYFREAGYRTAFLTSNVQIVSERAFDTGFDDFVTVGSGRDSELLDRSLQWLESHHEQPFFAWFHFLSPHTPYERREMASAFYDENYDGAFKRTSKGRFQVDNEADHNRIRDLYDGEVFYADYLFEQVMTQLESLGRLNDTLVVVTADHGEEFADHGQYQHNHVWEEIIRIPMLLRHPGAETGARLQAPYSSVDLLPTLAGIMGIDLGDKVTDGVDLTRMPGTERIKVIAAMTNKEHRQIAAIEGNNKLIVVCRPDYAEHLYDLAKDPDETTDLAPDRPDEVERLYDRLTDLTADQPCDAMRKAAQGVAPETGLTEEQVEQLKSLGYIQ